VIATAWVHPQEGPPRRPRWTAAACSSRARSFRRRGCATAPSARSRV